MKIRRWLFVVTIALLLIGMGRCLMGKRRFVSRLSREISDADSIVLQRYDDYYFPHVRRPESVVVDKRSIQQWLASLPVESGALWYGRSMCWIPHHRIILNFPDGPRNIEICFTCNKFTPDYRSHDEIPSEWESPLKTLFESHGLSSKAPTREEAQKWFDRELEEDSVPPSPPR